MGSRSHLVLTSKEIIFKGQRLIQRSKTVHDAIHCQQITNPALRSLWASAWQAYLLHILRVLHAWPVRKLFAGRLPGVPRLLLEVCPREGPVVLAPFLFAIGAGSAFLR